VTIPGPGDHQMLCVWMVVYPLQILNAPVLRTGPPTLTLFVSKCDLGPAHRISSAGPIARGVYMR